MIGEEITCWLCHRPIATLMQWHHTIPKSKGGVETVPVHPICHQAIHNNFLNSELAKMGNDRAAILERAAMQNFIDWVKDKPPDFHAPTRKKR